MLYDDVITGTYREKIVEGCKRLYIDHSILKLYKENFSGVPSFIENIKYTAIPQFEKMWLEINYGGDARIGCLVKGNKENHIVSMSFISRHEEIPPIRVDRDATYVGANGQMVTKIFMDDKLAEDFLVQSAMAADNKKFVGQLCADTLGIISMINSRNIIEQKEVTPKRERKVKPGQKKLLSYTIIKIKPEIMRNLKEAEENESGAKMSRKLHWRRGHFKHCRTGTFWWSAHLAGSAINGVVNSRYVAET